MAFDKQMLQFYAIAGTQDFPGPHAEEQLLKQLEALLQAGITLYQFRDKGPGSLAENPEAHLALAKKCHALTKRYHVPLIVDDDVDLALAISAEGIHVGQTDEGITSVIQRVPAEWIVGLSCNTPEEIQIANHTPGIDYIGVGSVFPTTSKADAGEAIGLSTLTQLVQISDLPLVAIGGITEARVTDVLKTGVAGIAAIRLFADMKEPATVLATWRHHQNQD